MRAMPRHSWIHTWTNDHYWAIRLVHTKCNSNHVSKGRL